jgi:GTP pyrophosphokinase
MSKISSIFGDEVALLVDGVTKLTKLELQSERSKQAENFRKLFLATSNDIRVLLVKLADRTHNMRTIGGISDIEKRQKIAQETLEVFAPLSERVGLIGLKNEMEDLAFAVVQPQMRTSIMNRLSFIQDESKDILPLIIEEIRETLLESGIKTLEISGRVKTAFSIWQKMQRRNVPMDQLSDIMAYRILVEKVEDCYSSLGVIHSKYPNVMGRFKDYISTKKRNGYQSLHTDVIGPFKQKIEIQIKTLDMHKIAETGIASHWVYKQNLKDIEKINSRWVQDLVSILDQEQGPEDFLENTKLEMYADKVFCFTPNGDLIALPRGATPVDFAYALHSDIGYTCVGVKINGKPRQLKTQLNNGDQVEILRSRNSTPNPEWENFIKTGRARASIKKFIRQKSQDEFFNVGIAILQKCFRQLDKKFNIESISKKLKNFKDTQISKPKEIFIAIGDGSLDPVKIINFLYPKINSNSAKKNIIQKKNFLRENKSENTLKINGLIPGMAVHIAKCCTPLPGENIVGIVTTGKGITVHTIDCNTLEKFYDIPERWLDIHWDKDGLAYHIGRINIVMTNEPGSLASVTNQIYKYGGNITNLQLINREIDFFRFIVDLEVEDLSHINNIIMELRSNDFVETVNRYQG